MELLLRYLFYFELLVGIITVIGISLTVLLERLDRLPRWAMRLRGLLTSIF